MWSSQSASEYPDGRGVEGNEAAGAEGVTRASPSTMLLVLERPLLFQLAYLLAAFLALCSEGFCGIRN